MIIVYIWTLYKDNMSYESTCERVKKTLELSPLTKESQIRDCLEQIKPFVIDFYWAFLHILDSNDSKFIKNEKWELVAIKNEAWKVQKWPNYFKPDLTRFIK